MATKKTPAAKGGKKDPAALVVAALELVLADTYVLAIKTHAYHWNVTGPQFGPLHAFFGEQYEALVDAADDIAERIRALGARVEGSMARFLADASIEEAGDKKLSDKAMLRDLLDSHAALVAALRASEEIADDVDDVATEDLMVERIRAHDKMMWMIRSHIE